MTISAPVPVDWNPVCTIWAAMPDGEGLGGVKPDPTRPLWRGSLVELARYHGAPHQLLMSEDACGWSAEPAPGHCGPLNGYRI